MAEVEIVVATLNINFEPDTEAGGTLKLEIDDREDGFNGGDTSFQPGDRPVFFMFKGDSVDLLTEVPRSTAGSVARFSPSSDTKEIDEYISFSNSSTGSLGYPPNNTPSLTWAGQSYQLKGTTLTQASPAVDNDSDALTVRGGLKMIGLLHAVYTTEGSLWQLNSADLPEVMVFAVGTITRI